jgi:hypothetical protein
MECVPVSDLGHGAGGTFYPIAVRPDLQTLYPNALEYRVLPLSECVSWPHISHPYANPFNLSFPDGDTIINRIEVVEVSGFKFKVDDELKVYLFENHQELMRLCVCGGSGIVNEIELAKGLTRLLRLDPYGDLSRYLRRHWGKKIHLESAPRMEDLLRLLKERLYPYAETRQCIFRSKV